MTTVNKLCGCYGTMHHSRCKYFVKPETDTSSEFVNKFVGTSSGKAVWNAALDAAAARCDEVLECIAAARIRELRK